MARVGPALDDAFVGLLENELELQQRDHDAQWHARSSGIALNGHTLHLFTEKIQIGQGHTGEAFAGEDLGSLLL